MLGLILEIFLQLRKPLLYFGLLFLIFLLSVPFFMYNSIAREIDNKNFLMNGQKPGLTLLDSNGKPFFSFGSKDISFIPIPTIPNTMQQAIIAAEDKDFYANLGFSIPSILRALVVDIMTGQLKQGGSTITQQLVKNALLTPQKSFIRKYQEITLAYVITKRYTKREILEMYLNSVYFGNGSFGVENASETYFGIHAKDLDLAQSALLASLVPAPSELSPLSNNPAIAKKHQEKVLSEMQQDGFITSQQASKAKNETLYYNHQQQAINILAPHFALMVRDMLYKKYGEENVMRSGFKVKTTLSKNYQEYAEEVVKNKVANLVKDGATNGAAVVIDPKTGQILSLVGSHDWFDPNNGKINMALSPRQPGSSFKPIIYSAALSQRLITPATILEDIPTTFPGNYSPHDYDGKYRGPVTVRRALSNSLNIPSVEVMGKLGVPEGIAQAKLLGIPLSNSTAYGLSLVLGAANAPLLDITNAYAVFADEGVYHQPTPILEIKDKYGDIVDRYQNNPQQVIDNGTAFLISSILSDNKARAEEFGNALTISRPAAVKTGTSEDFRDSLTIGYTPSLTIGVWVGNNDNTPMDGIAGSLGAAPIWKALMEHFLSGTPIETFNPPLDVVEEMTCPYELISNSPLASSSAYPEYFLTGTQPQGNSCFTNPTNTPQIFPTFVQYIESPTPSTLPLIFPSPIITPTPTPQTIEIQFSHRKENKQLFKIPPNDKSKQQKD